LAFVRWYLSLYDYSELEWITLRRPLRRSWRDVHPSDGGCTHRQDTSSGLYRINCAVFADARYPAEFRYGERDESGKLLPFFLKDENEAVVDIIAHEVSHYLGWTGQVPANGKVDSGGFQTTSEAQANAFTRGALEAYRHSIGDATFSDELPGTLGPLARRGWCVECGRRLSTGGGSRAFCSDRCRSRYHNRQRRARMAARRGKMVCEVCGARFTPKRRDAKTCSRTCRQKKYRKLRKDRTVHDSNPDHHDHHDRAGLHERV
jgi:predicted nucleic acid-binding Zn ribbon protein